MQMRADPDFKKLQKRLTTKGISDALVMQTANQLVHKNTLTRLKEIANGEIEEAKEEKSADGPGKDEKEIPAEVKPNQKKQDTESESAE